MPPMTSSTLLRYSINSIRLSAELISLLPLMAASMALISENISGLSDHAPPTFRIASPSSMFPGSNVRRSS